MAALYSQARLQKVTQSAQQQHERVSKVLLDPLDKAAVPQIDLKGLNAIAAQITGELQVVSAGGLSEQSAEVIAARKLLTSVQDQISAHKAEALTALRAAMVQAREGRVAEPLQAAVEAAATLLGDDAAAAESISEAKTLLSILSKEKALRVSLAAVCESARDLRQLAPLQEALAAALAGGGNSEWQEVVAAQELVAVITKENELAVSVFIAYSVHNLDVGEVLKSG